MLSSAGSVGRDVGGMGCKTYDECEAASALLAGVALVGGCGGVWPDRGATVWCGVQCVLCGIWKGYGGGYGGESDTTAEGGFVCRSSLVAATGGGAWWRWEGMGDVFDGWRSEEVLGTFWYTRSAPLTRVPST